LRYARADRLIQLALEMQAARGGLTLTDIEQRFGVSRRTAIRMRDAVVAAFPQADEVPSNDRSKRWRIEGAPAQALAGISAEELAILENAATALEGLNLADQADAVRGVASKIKASVPPPVLRRIEPDLAALAEAEGLALSAGPRPFIPASTFATLRLAIQSCRKVAFHYEARTSGQSRHRSVSPLGFLYGHRHYLVGQEDSDDPELARRIRTYSLPLIRQLKLLPEAFERDPGFDLQQLVAGAFGVFHEPPHDVEWRFAPQAAPVARQFQFHPSQVVTENPDGSLTVSFRAGGLMEMAWHLMMWGRHVEVMKPQALKDLLPEILPDWPVLP
jgi:predicted DNA-binding transcriptional regulator YafY